MTIQLLRNRLEQQKGQQQQIQKSLSSLQQQLQEKTLSLHKHEQAKEIIRAVGLQTQQTLQVNISDITSLALEAVFPDPYELKVEFLQRRNKTECDLYFVRDGNRVDPLTASGVGAMMQPHTRNTIILDEPFRFLSENYQEQAAQMLKQISIKLGIQMIIVTHNETLASSADKVFNVSIRKGISKVQTNN
jgi:hypothetical protein